MIDHLLLVHLPDTPLDGSRPVVTPPIGLWSMRTNNAGHAVRVLDLNVTPLPYSLTVDNVGYSLLFPAHELRLEEARLSIYAEKEFYGGPTGSRLNREFKNAYNVVGPGEDWLAEKRLRFADLQPPRFSTSEMLPYWKANSPFSGFLSGLKWMPVETSRGCPNECGFCAIPYLWGAWQSRPLEMLDEYFGYLVQAHGIQEILVIDDNVAASAARFISIIELFKKHSLSWSIANGIYNRALLREDVREALRGSRCLYLSLPFEAGNPRTAERMNLGRKYLDFDEAMFLTACTRELGIHTAGQFIIGYPGDTEQDVAETLRYANALLLDQRHIHIATPLPGTPMYDECYKKGYLTGDPATATYKTPIVETPMLSRARLYFMWSEDRKAALNER